MTTKQDQPADETEGTESSKETDTKPADDVPDRPNGPKGRAWRINEDPPDDPEADNDLHSRFGDDYDGEAWRINENTKD